jgi:thiamine biosynthesis lipoprotein
VRVTDHHAAPPGAPGQTVTLESGGIATSSTTVRRWAHRDGVHHHLLDPRTLLPAVEYWRTASVAAGSCTDANIASTTAILLAAGAPDWLAAMRLPARLVTPSGDVVRVAGWPPAGGSTGTPDHE